LQFEEAATFATKETLAQENARLEVVRELKPPVCGIHIRVGKNLNLGNKFIP